MLHLAPIAGQQDLSKAILPQHGNTDQLSESSNDDPSLPSLLNSENRNICNEDKSLGAHDAHDANENASKDEAKPFHWTAVEEVEGLDGDAVCHMKAFYELLQSWYLNKEYTSVLLTKADYAKQVKFLCYLKEGGVTVDQAMSAKM
jgi:hypothetical protein